MKLVVAGGNGFIGSEICRVAVENGHEVVGFGRSGEPGLLPVKHPWVRKMEWRACDVFDTGAWTDALDEADAVVHSIATIQNDPSRGITFDRVNGESAILVAEEAQKAGVGSFVFLSVQEKPPFVSGRFLAAKRRAEREIPEQFPDLRSVILRANLVFGPGRPGTGSIAGLLDLLGPVAPGNWGNPSGRPLPVEVVAAAAVHAARTPTIEGTLGVEQIDGIGRTSGLLDLDAISEASALPLVAGLGGTLTATWLLRRWMKG